jgi:hypothetical protein
MASIERSVVDDVEAWTSEERVLRMGEAFADAHFEHLCPGIVSVLDQFLQDQEFIRLSSIEKNALDQFDTVGDESCHKSLLGSVRSPCPT